MTISYPLAAPQPDFNSSASVSPRTLMNEFGDGYRERATDGLNTQRNVWELTWTNCTTPEKDALKTMFEQSGGVETISWQAFGDIDTKLWTPSKWTWTPVDAGYWTVRCTFTQEFDPGVVGPSGSPYISEVTEIEAAVGTVTAEHLGIIEQAILMMKSGASPVWDTLDGFYFFGVPDNLALALTDWTHPHMRLAPSIVPPVYSQGFTGAANRKFTSGFTPSQEPASNFSLDSACIGVFTETNLAAAGSDIGEVSSNRSYLTTRDTSDRISGRINDATTFVAATGHTTSVGHSALNRSASNARQAYKDGALVGSDTAVSTAQSAANLGFFVNNGTFSLRRVSAGYYGGSQTLDQHIQLNDAISYLRTAFGLG